MKRKTYPLRKSLYECTCGHARVQHMSSYVGGIFAPLKFRCTICHCPDYEELILPPENK